MIDPFAAGVAALIAAKAVAGFGEQLGNDTASSLERLIASVRRRFRGDAHAEQALERVDDEPGDRAATAELATVLDQYMQADEGFRADIAELLRTTRPNQELSQFLVQITGNAEVGKIVNIGEVHGNLSF
jgi:hypothetical protein